MEKNNRKNKKLNIFILLFGGFLLCYMAATMYIGGSLNFREFLSAGRVYDFSQKELKISSGSWQYSEADQGYWIQKQRALHKWGIDGTQSAWGYLYLQVKELSAPSAEMHIYYFNRNGDRVAEQGVWLTQGKNVIALERPDVGMYKIGLRLLGMKGGFISIKSMQLREKGNGFFLQRFIKIMAVAYTGFLAACGCLLLLKKRMKWKFPWQKWREGWLETLQFAYRIFLEGLCKKIHDKITAGQRVYLRKLLFCLLFLWMTTAELMGWLGNEAVERYYLLSFSAIVILIGILMWEKKLSYVNWNHHLSLAWIWLWIGTLLVDWFVTSKIKYHGCVMLLACGCFIFLWNNRKGPESILYEIMQALEIDFIIATIFCMLFRTKKLTIRYNGFFNSSEYFAMYAVLMLAVFLTEIDRMIRRKESLKKYVAYVTGAAVSLYFLLRASNESGYAAAGGILIIFVIRQILERKEWFGQLHIVFRNGTIAGLIGILCVCGVHFSTKYLPAFLGTEIEYQHETLISNVSREEMKKFEALQPGLMKAKSYQDQEYGIKWKNYIRRLGLNGKRGRLMVNRRRTTAYNGYIQMAYQYGFFILLPYVVIQICMIIKGVSFLKRRSTDMWLFMVTTIFVCFCLLGNVENDFWHPLWFCYYIGMGYWFVDKVNGEERIGDIEKGILE
ncbi:MAG: hypothetical protein HFH41_05765 [Lachnospiraceae bacterium]|nr:hypothetical protein [Lachnospiraceae bacterium]